MILAAQFGLIYVLLVLASASLWFFPRPRLLAGIAIVGGIEAVETWRLQLEMRSLFFGNPLLYGSQATGRVKYAGLSFILFLAMVVIFLSSANVSARSGKGFLGAKRIRNNP